MNINILRPRRLTQMMPYLKRELPILATHFHELSGCITMTGFERLQSCKWDIQHWINMHLEAMPIDARAEWTQQIFDAFVEIETVAAFRAFGEQAFVFDDDVFEALSRTDLAGVRAVDLQCPYPTFYMQFPIADMSSAARAVEGAYVRAINGNILIVLCALDRNYPSWAIQPRYEVTIRRDGDQDLCDVILETISSLKARAAKDRGEISAAITGLPYRARVGLREKMSGERAAREFEENTSLIAHGLSVACNALCLLTASPEAELGPRGLYPKPFQVRPGTSHKTVSGACEVRFVSFGKTGQNNGTGGGNDRDSPLPHWRRGHWRRQPIGPRSAVAHVLRWIRPTVVSGGRNDVAHARIYKVTGDHHAH